LLKKRTFSEFLYLIKGYFVKICKALQFYANYHCKKSKSESAFGQWFINMLNEEKREIPRVTISWMNVKVPFISRFISLPKTIQ